MDAIKWAAQIGIGGEIYWNTQLEMDIFETFTVKKLATRSGLELGSFIA